MFGRKKPPSPAELKAYEAQLSDAIDRGDEAAWTDALAGLRRGGNHVAMAALTRVGDHIEAEADNRHAAWFNFYGR